MDRYRLIGAIVFIYLGLLVQYPAPTMIFSLVILILYLIIRFVPYARATVFSNNSDEYQRRQSRLAALGAASMFLAPYRDIWRDLRLSNKFCSVSLSHDGNRIVVKEKKNDYTNFQNSFAVLYSKYSTAELWDIICLNFNYSTTYNELKENCKFLFDATISELDTGTSSYYAPKQAVKEYTKITETTSTKANKVDVNNASEIELTALPGISIVMSKRIIKKREEIRGFKNINEFFIFIKVKPHMEEQLRKIVCVEKMKGSVKIERFKERKLDI